MSVFYYMRISTAEDRELQKYTRQEKALERYAKENGCDYDNHYVYKEDRSGCNFEDRVEWQKLEKTLHAGDTIVFKDICRFTREKENGLKKYMWLMNDKKVKLVFIDNPTLSTDYIKALGRVKESDDKILALTMDYIVKLILTVELDRAEKERITLSRRIADGVHASEKKSGRAVGKLDKLTTELRADSIRYNRDRTVTQKELMDKHGISRNTLKKYVAFI